MTDLFEWLIDGVVRIWLEVVRPPGTFAQWAVVIVLIVAASLLLWKMP